MNTARTALATIALVAGLVLTGCSGTAAAPPDPTGSETPVPTTTPDPQPTPTVTEAAEPTCETIIPATTVEDFTGLGWEPLQEPFVLTNAEVEGGILCKWGDPAVPSDHVQIYGWAPLSAAEAGAAQLDLVANGWIREDAAEGVYITESAETATGTDDQGYGWTYLFGDGWVKFADTKQSLLLVEWPPS